MWTYHLFRFINNETVDISYANTIEKTDNYNETCKKTEFGKAFTKIQWRKLNSLFLRPLLFLKVFTTLEPLEAFFSLSLALRICSGSIFAAVQIGSKFIYHMWKKANFTREFWTNRRIKTDKTKYVVSFVRTTFDQWHLMSDQSQTTNRWHVDLP